MLKNITPRKRITNKEYELVFDDGRGNGYGFDCEADGTLKPMSPVAETSLAWCKAHVDSFVRAGEIIELRRTYTEPACGTCDCGARVELVNQYFGACECPGCGQWYNLFGEDILPPKQWGEDLYEMDY